MLLVSVGFLVAARISKYQNAQVFALGLKKQEISVLPSKVIGLHPDFEGNYHSPYTLVEFGDYECPPCHLAFHQVNDVLRLYKGQVRFVFRQYPLSDIHPYAQDAATVAEAARIQGKLWKVHSLLYQSNVASFDESTIAFVIRAQNINMNRAYSALAAKAVQTDAQEAQELKISGTPTFILCCPDQKVIQLKSLEQIAYYLK